MKTPKMTEEIKQFFREVGSRGGKKASASMTQSAANQQLHKTGRE